MMFMSELSLLMPFTLCAGARSKDFRASKSRRTHVVMLGRFLKQNKLYLA